MLTLNVTVKNLDKVIEQLNQIGIMYTDLSTEFGVIGDYLIDFFSRDVFETEGAIFDEAWQELSPDYEKRKAVTYPGRGILERTGTLRYNFHAISTSDHLIVYNPTPYGKYHEQLDGPGSGNLPQRVFMKIDQERAEIIRGMIVENLNQRMKDIVS